MRLNIFFGGLSCAAAAAFILAHGGLSRSNAVSTKTLPPLTESFALSAVIINTSNEDVRRAVRQYRKAHQTFGTLHGVRFAKVVNQNMRARTQQYKIRQMGRNY